MPIQIDAKLNAFRRSAKGFFITLELSPDCDWEELARAPLGQAFGVAMVPYDAETGKPVAPKAVEKPERERKPFHAMSRAQQAGILCQDQTFRLWISTAYPNTANLTDCADAVRLLCDVHSRADLATDRAAGKKWDQLVTDFYQGTGRMAEAR